ncbi:MAG: tol-pal system protein YbgF [Desulfarculus sp.]|nr:MAG: tol-pal system protein YbgF [Desulfarculus sp.]
MNRRLLACVAAAGALILASGCATVEPRDFTALQSQVTNQQRQITQLRQKVDEMARQVESGRRPRAELTTDVAALRQEIMRLSGRLDEADHRLGQAPNASAIQAATKELSAKNDKTWGEMDRRLARLEAYLGLQGKSKTAPAAGAAAPAAAKAQGNYELGQRLYKQKSYEAARDRFSAYLNENPKSSRAASAQYWVGETYYAQNKYEEAILAYNQVVKRFPKSSLVPSSLLKQGLAFRALGDKRTAKIVLNKLVKSYPKSSQAQTAKKVLAKL